MKWYERDPDEARLDILQARYGLNCCGEFPVPAHVRHFVYVVGRDRGPTKIGLCLDLAKRIRAIQTACPFSVDLFWSASVASREIAREIELEVLRSFPRSTGEWMATDPLKVISILEPQV